MHFKGLKHGPDRVNGKLGKHIFARQEEHRSERHAPSFHKSLPGAEVTQHQGGVIRAFFCCTDEFWTRTLVELDR